MNATLLNRPIGEFVKERSARSTVFEDLGLDYCCGGNVPLAEACQRKGIDVEQVARRLEEVDRQSAGADANEVDRLSLSALIDHIIEVHHQYLRQELPRLETLLQRVLEAHGARHPELQEIRDLFERLRVELTSHTSKEEQMLFPAIKRIERAGATGTRGREACFGSVAQPIFVMEREHDDAGAAVGRIRALTRDYRAPEDACTTYHMLMERLKAFEADLHRHVHKENAILFPKAIRLEAEGL